MLRRFSIVLSLATLTALVACGSDDASPAGNDGGVDATQDSSSPQDSGTGSNDSGNDAAVDANDAGNDARLCEAMEGRSFSTPQCDSCIELTCCAPLTTCVENTDCRALLDCLLSCGPEDESCVGGCFDAHPEGEAGLDPIEECLGMNCFEDCRGGGGGGGGGS